MVNQPTRVTRTSRTLIDHIVTNYPQNITHTGIIPCSIISDHDAVFARINTRVARFQPRYKYIRIEKNLDESAFREEFSSVPLNIVYGLDSPGDVVDAMNTLMRECINRQAPLRRVKVTQPPASWLKSDEIRKLQSERDVLRVRARKYNTEETWTAFRTIRNKIKSMISKAKRSFLVNALSSMRLKEVWKIIHRVLHPNLKSLRADPNEVNKYFISTATRTLGTKPDDVQDLFHQINLLPETCELNRFSLRHTTHGEVLHEISQLRSDCSTGYDQIPSDM